MYDGTDKAWLFFPSFSLFLSLLFFFFYNFNELYGLTKEHRIRGHDRSIDEPALPSAAVLHFAGDVICNGDNDNLQNPMLATHITEINE